MKKINIKANKKEIIITILVLTLSVVIGFIIGEELFEALYGNI